MIRFFAGHPTAANLLMIVFVAMGVIAFPGLERATFPDFDADQVQVRVVYPGASAGDVEEAICQRIEDAVDGIGSVAEISSEAREGVGTVVVEMDGGGTLQSFIDDIRTAVDAIDDFPEQAETPVIEKLGETQLVVAVAVTGDMDPPALKAYCDELKRTLQLEYDVALVDVLGFSDHQIRIEIPSLTLMQYGVSAADVATTIQQQAVDLPAGTVSTAEREVMIRFTDQRRSPAEFEDLVVVARRGGAEIRLGDIATITDTFEQAESKVELNGRRAGLLKVDKSDQEDALEVFDRVAAFVADTRATAPPGVELTLVQDVSSIVRDRLSMLLTNGWQGLVLVFLAMWLFFSLRYSFWVTVGLPVSFLGASFLMLQLGMTINMISMVGLLLAIGLLMDDAIVIAENVASHIERRKPALRAVIDGVNEVRVGVFASFITTICVFGPLCFLSGSIGKTMRVMPLVLIMVLVVSLVEAFLILPNHLAHSLAHRKQGPPSRFRRRFEERFEQIRERWLGRLVDTAVRWRYLTLGLTVMAFLASISMLLGGVLKFVSFPNIDGDVVQARLLLPQGTPLERTEDVVEQLIDALDRVNDELTPLQPDEQRLVGNVSTQYGVNSDAFETGPHLATVTVDLLSAEVRSSRIDDILARWREELGELPDLVFLTLGQPTMGPAGRPFEIRLQGRDLVALKQASTELLAWMSDFNGVLDLNDDLRPGKPELRVRLREGATGLGLTAQSIAQQLRGAFFGSTASEIQVGPESYEIDVRLAAADQDSFGDIEYFHVSGADGRQVPLSTVATVEWSRGWARIARINGLRTVTVRGDVDSDVTNTAEIAATLRGSYLPGFLERHLGVHVELAGEVAETQTTSRSIARSLAIGMLGVFILLSFQFRSYIEPAVVMVAIPFALIGVIWGHLALGLVLTMTSMVGFVSLAGIVVNDSILLVEFIKNRRREGRSVGESARMASRERFRAVLLTSVTTIAGLLPLLTERSLQAQFLIPLVASLVFGLMASTVLVLVVIPSLYTILGDLGLVSDVER